MIEPVQTVSDIARKVGVSPATVSRVLNNTRYVNPEARQAVLSAVREMKQPPKLLGRRAKAKVDAAGLVQIVVLNRIKTDPVEAATRPRSLRIARMIEGITQELRKVGLLGVVQSVDSLNDPALLASLNSSETRGIFLNGIYGEDVHAFLEHCRAPVVSFMTWNHNGWPDYVGIDNLTGIRLGFDHLYELGHRRIGYVAGELRFSQVFSERLAAYKMFMAKADLLVRNDWVTEGSCDLSPMEKGVLDILQTRDRPTAILCAFDGAALAVRRAADKLGLRIPNDLSVIGFDDDEVAHLFSPPLTTVRVPVELMGRHGVQLLAMRQQYPITPGEGVSVRVTPTLVVRESSTPPATH